MDICCHCKKPFSPEDKGPKDVIFEYDGLKFKGWKSGFSCSSCEADSMKEGYELLKKEGILKRKEVKASDSVFEIVDGVPYHRIMEEGIDIDWIALQKYVHLMSEYRESKDVISALREIGILSFDPNGNYAVVAAGMFSSLFDSSFHIFFTRAKDASAVAELKYGRAEYPWGVIRCEVSLKSERGVV